MAAAGWAVMQFVRDQRILVRSDRSLFDGQSGHVVKAGRKTVSVLIDGESKPTMVRPEELVSDDAPADASASFHDLLMGPANPFPPELQAGAREYSPPRRGAASSSVASDDLASETGGYSPSMRSVGSSASHYTDKTVGSPGGHRPAGTSSAERRAARTAEKRTEEPPDDFEDTQRRRMLRAARDDDIDAVQSWLMQGTGLIPHSEFAQLQAAVMQWPAPIAGSAPVFGANDPFLRVRKYLATIRKLVTNAADDAMLSFADAICGLEKTVARTHGTKKAAMLRDQLHQVMQSNFEQLLQLKNATMEQSADLAEKAAQLVTVLSQAQHSYDAGLAELEAVSRSRRVPMERVAAARRLAAAKLDQIRQQALDMFIDQTAQAAHAHKFR